MKLSLVIPCYNEEKNIEPFMKCCIETFGNNKNIEYIFYIVISTAPFNIILTDNKN